MRGERVILAISCVAVLACLATWTVLRDRSREQRLAAVMTRERVIDPASVAQAVRTMKLITTQVPTTVRVEKKIDSFLFGEGSAAVETPVVVSFGTDLSNLKSSGIEVEGAGRRAIIRARVPRPTCVGVTVLQDASTTSVQRSWRRIGWWSGDDQAKDAKLEAFNEANRLRLQPIEKSLAPADREKIDRFTREQVASLIKAIVGDWVEVEVAFEGEP